MKKVLTHDPGCFVRISLADGTFGYGRILDQPNIALYNFWTTEPCLGLDEIESKPVLFRSAVLTSGLKKWEMIGKKPLEGDVALPVVKFMQDEADFRKCTIFDTMGMEKDVAPEACIGIERAAVWEPRDIEERLLDAFLGRPNPSEMHLRVRLE